MTETSSAAILVVRRSGGYKDIPGIRYHFPKARYLSRLRELMNCLVIFYEPRRGGTSATTGGRMGFTGFAFIDKLWEDQEDATHAFVGFRYFVEFIRVVPLTRTSVSPQSLEHAVRPIDFAEAETVVREGLFEPRQLRGEREGLTDIDVLSTVGEREMRQVIRDQAVREATFRFRVVEQAYRGRCALTGVRMTNGNGRAEVDAAHIRPVAANGPDSVRNGLALMKSMHWAFDRGLVALSDDGTILAVDRGVEDSIRRLLLPSMQAALPAAIDERPHAAFLAWHRENVFKGPRALSRSPR